MLGYYSFLPFKGINNRIVTFVAKHNANHTDQEGKKELRFHIRNTRMSALRNIINAYSKYINAYKNNKDWHSATQLPEMPINRQTIAKMVGCCTKSAYNHVEFLVEAGVLLKKWHGRQNDFSVIVNPYFFLEEYAENLQFADLKIGNEEPLFSPFILQNLPPISSYDSQEIDNHYKKDVESVNISRKDSEQPFKNTSYTVSRTDLGAAAELGHLSTTFSTELKKLVKNIKDKDNGTAVGGATKDLIPLESSPQISKEESEAWHLVDKFTRFAFDKLYPNTFYSEKTISQVKNLVMQDVFNNFIGDTKDIIRIRNRYIDAKAALDNALEYAEKHRWTSFLPPKCYFSRDFFKSGKRGTFFEALEWRLTQKEELQHAKAISIVENCKRLVALEKSPKGHRELTTRLQISQYCTSYIAKRCGAAYVSVFNTWLANPENFL